MGIGIKTRRGESKGQLLLILYDTGNENIAVTGGWQGITYGGGIFTKNIGNIFIRSYRASVYTTNKIDLTEYTTLKAYVYTRGRSGTQYNSQFLYTGSQISNQNGWCFGGSNQYSTALLQANYYKASADYIELSLDISSLSGSHHIALTSDDSASVAFMDIYKVWLE